MAIIKIIPDYWGLNSILVDEDGNKAVGGKIITKDGDVKDYPVHRRIIDTVSMLKSNVRKKGFVEGLFSKEIDTGEEKSPFSR